MKVNSTSMWLSILVVALSCLGGLLSFGVLTARHRREAPPQQFDPPKMVQEVERNPEAERVAYNLALAAFEQAQAEGYIDLIDLTYAGYQSTCGVDWTNSYSQIFFWHGYDGDTKVSFRIIILSESLSSLTGEVLKAKRLE